MTFSEHLFFHLGGKIICENSGFLVSELVTGSGEQEVCLYKRYRDITNLKTPTEFKAK